MRRMNRLAGALLLIATTIAPQVQAAESKASPDGTLHAPAYDLPLSVYMSEEAKRSIADGMIAISAVDSMDANPSIEEQRRVVNRTFFEPLLDRARRRYAVNVEERKIAGVPTVTVTPRNGVAERHRRRVLINLHCGGFTLGTGVAGLLESTPIAATGGFRIVSIDYRLAPENSFPAANEDVAAVYTHSRLIKAGVRADLHVWEGMSHGFLLDVGLPESREAFDVIVGFFDERLGS